MSATAPLAAGEILAGKYRVGESVGEGGMGYVFVAEHIQLGHKVALKVLRSTAVATEEAVERFLREARAAARLQSDHVARVTDVGTTEDGVPYMVMEYLDGVDLAHVIQNGGFTYAEAVDYVVQACEALADAHRHGIVHRDLKPANLFLTRKIDGAPFVKVLDFGISKTHASLLGTPVAEITSTAAMIGSPKYMSPEQMQDSRLVDARADIWALGAILYEMLAGRRAFDAPTLATTCVQILQDDPKPFGRDDVPAELEAVVMKCLRKDPDERYASVAELVEALAPFAPDSHTTIARIGKMMSTSDGIKIPRTSSSGGAARPDSSPSMKGLATPRLGSGKPTSGKTKVSGSTSGGVIQAATPAEGPEDKWAKGRAVALAAVMIALIVFAFAGLRGERASTQQGKPELPKVATQPDAVEATVASAGVASEPASASASAPASASASASASAPAPASAAPHHAPRPPRPPKPAPSAGVSDSVLEDRR